MLYHGRVDARKGVLDLLEACRRLRDGNEKFRLLISGIGPTYDATEAAIPRLALQDCVSMTGYVDYADVPAVYRRASIFVSPTYAEGFSNTILEAMASRMAVVSCRSVGVVDCIRDGENGLLTEPGDIGALTDALRRTLREPDLRHRLADAALAECRAVYSWPKVGGQIMAVYQRLAGSAPDLSWSAELPMTPLPLPRRAASAVTQTALFVSPHLDDVVFSCGGTLAALADRGWRTVMVTAFTASVLPATGFALACQLDKGLPPDIDYMALRRGEDRVAADILGVADLRWLDLPEAPHRGYCSPPALFADIRDGDDVWRPLADRLAALIGEVAPTQIFAPQGLGSHVDHRQSIRAVECSAGDIPVAWYRDTPYAIRNPDAISFVAASYAGTLPVEATLERKLRAACAYRSQIDFQFGGPEATEAALRAFTASERGERFSGVFNESLVQP